MEDSSRWIDWLESDGFALIPRVIDIQQVESLIASLETLTRSNSFPGRGGIRNLLEASAEVRALAESPCIRSIVCPVLGEDAFPVRGILFDKTEGANWKVPWHQDLTIAVSERILSDGFGAWSMKAGIQHVQPPDSVLGKMVSVRIHIDDCSAENGALKVVPGTHKRGRLSEKESPRIGTCGPVTLCGAKAGDVVLMRPLLVHSSSASENPGHRRVIHLDYASEKLPGRLKWAHDQTQPQQLRSGAVQSH